MSLAAGARALFERRGGKESRIYFADDFAAESFYVEYLYEGWSDPSSVAARSSLPTEARR